MAKHNLSGQEILDGITGRMVRPYSDMLIGESVLGEALAQQNPLQTVPGFKQTTNFRPNYAIEQEKRKSKRTIAKIFSNLSRWGMDVEDDVINNMRAIPADKNLLPKEFQLANQDLFSQLTNPWLKKSNAEKSFFEKDFAQKVATLRELAMQPELEDILDTMSNEAIVYDDKSAYFADPYIDANDIGIFAPDVQKRINDVVSSTFKSVYRMLGWKDRAWDDFKRFLIEGIMSWEIVYDSLEKPTKIVGLVPIDPATITKKYDNGKWYWVQFKGIQGKEKKLLDAQIIYISFQETKAITRLSYLERLIRPFNIYRIIEQAQLVWTVTNAQYKIKFTVPTKGMNKIMAAQTLASTMNRYKEDIKFNGNDGSLTFNGQVNMPFNKEYWLPDGDSGSPEIEQIGGDGPDLVDNDQLKYFKNNLYKISKIPLSRFDQDSGESWFGTDASSYARTEIDFGRYVGRLRNTFSQIILKPIQIQLALTIPDLEKDKDFLGCIGLKYHSMNLFAELMDMDIMQKRVDFIQAMKDGLIDMDPEGNEVKYFSSEFLVRKYLGLSDSDRSLNDELKKEEIEKLNLAGGNQGGDDGFGDGFEDLNDNNIDMIIEQLRKLKGNPKKRKRKKKDEEE